MTPQSIVQRYFTSEDVRFKTLYNGSLGIAVIVTPAVALLAGGSATAAGTGGSSRQLVKTLYNRRMDIPERVIPDFELRKQNGERGARKFIAYQGIVYDVTDCPKWRLDLHENLHFPGQDLTSELPDAPHEEDVFTRPCVKVVGRLKRSGDPVE
jgi:predicted heme/steroid binding protein